MAHLQKYTKSAIGGLFKNHQTDRDKHKHSNKNIDRNLSHLNYSLVDITDPIKQLDMRIKDITIKRQRDDINYGVEVIITKPRQITQEESKIFFDESCKFLSERYGKENVLWANVHLDEVTPHLHYMFIPVAPDKKAEKDKPKFKLCAKEVITQKELKRFHGDLDKHMKNVFGRDVGITTGQTMESIDIEKFKLKKHVDNLREEYKLVAIDFDNQSREKLSEAADTLAFAEADNDAAIRKLTEAKQARELAEKTKKEVDEKLHEVEKFEREVKSRQESLEITKKNLDELSEKIGSGISLEREIKDNCKIETIKTGMFKSEEKAVLDVDVINKTLSYVHASGIKDEQIETLSNDLYDVLKILENTQKEAKDEIAKNKISMTNYQEYIAELEPENNYLKKFVTCVEKIAPQIYEKAKKIVGIKTKLER